MYFILLFFCFLEILKTKFSYFHLNFFLLFTARADAERQVHQAQSLWSACQALWASVRTGEPGVAWQKRLRPLASEVCAVSKAGGKYYF